MIHARTLCSVEYDKITDFFASLCVSEAGKNLANAVKPLASADEAQAAFTLYEEATVWIEAPTSRGLAITDFPDISGLLSIARDNRNNTQKRDSYVIDLDAFWALKTMCGQGKLIYDSICVDSAERHWPHLLAFAHSAQLPVQLAAALNRCISNDGLLKDESSPELFNLRNEIRKLHQNCLHKVKEFANRYNMAPWLQDEFMTLSSDRYVLPLKANFKGRLQGIIHDWSQTGETCYFEPMFLVEINNRLQELKHQEREEERKVLRYLTDLLETEFEAVESLYNLLAHVDLLHAKILLAQKLHATSITFTADNEGIELLEARHPLLFLSRLKDTHETSAVKPLDIILRPGERVLVITGGNAGGKTVCLKTLGIVSAMAMSGLPVPVAKGSHLPWFGRMDAFIGDEQSLDANVSTFTAQIDHLAKAWKHLDNCGLVLLDEFGAGTDPAEGAALAQSVLDGLLEKHCFVLSATHFPALKSYALTHEGVRAASMLFNPVSNKPLFKLAYDQVGSSQALVVAGKHGLPESIISRARHYLLQDGADSSALMARLNMLATEREVEIERLRQEEKNIRNVLKDKTDHLERERARLRDEIRDKVSELMGAWKAGKTGAKQTLKEMSGLRAELGLDNANTSVLPVPQSFALGQTVLHTSFNKRGIIKDLDERRNRARLEMNGVSLWADFKNLRVPGDTGENKKAANSGYALSKKSSAPASISIDVRGKRADEALAMIERFLDDALLAGYSEVEIIHGRGTGALRREIHEYLRAFPAFHFSLAPEDRGGDGMTIVELN